jgi:hypothetical protein
MTLLTNALTLTLTKKSAIDPRIWKGCQFKNTLKSAKSAIVFFQSLSKLVYNEASWMNETHLYNGLVYDV